MEQAAMSLETPYVYSQNEIDSLKVLAKKLFSVVVHRAIQSDVTNRQSKLKITIKVSHQFTTFFFFGTPLAHSPHMIDLQCLSLA